MGRIICTTAFLKCWVGVEKEAKGRVRQAAVSGKSVGSLLTSCLPATPDRLREQLLEQ